MIDKYSHKENYWLSVELQETVNSLKKILQKEVSQPKVKILFVTASPKDKSSLRTTEEIQKIRECLQQSKYGLYFDFILEVGSHKTKLQNFLTQYQPDIFHFSGHIENESGFLFENYAGYTEYCSIEEFSSLLKLFKNKTKLIFLNTGYTDFGEKISKIVDFVIVPSADIEERYLIEFSTAFYQAIGNGFELKKAYELAQARIANLPEGYCLLNSNRDEPKYFLPKKYSI